MQSRMFHGNPPSTGSDAARRVSFAVRIVLVGVIVLACAACGADSSTDADETGTRSTTEDSRSPIEEGDAEAFFSQFATEADEASYFETLEDVSAASDSVVIGQPLRFRLSRTIQGDAAEDVVSYAAMDVEIVTLVAGRSVDVVPVEFLVNESDPERAIELIEALDEALPDQRLMIFLHEKEGEGEAGLFRLTTSGGLWVDTASGVIAPLDVNARDRFADELESVTSITELAERFASDRP